MPSSTVSALLQLISAAVTPVVMISACAALILGINNKHTALSDRIRSFTAECRHPDTASERRQQLLEEIHLFYIRFRLTWYAMALLYSAVGAFTLMILVIVLAQRHSFTNDAGTLSLFLLGILLMVAASALEVFEVSFSNRSLCVELRDVCPPTPRKPDR